MIGAKPGDTRGFLHKSKFGKFIGGAVKTLVPGVGQAVSAFEDVKSFLGGGGLPPDVPGRKSFGRNRGITPTPLVLPTGTPGGGRGGTACDFPMEIAPDGTCREPTVDRFGVPLDPFGEAQVGRFGAGLVPAVRAGVTRHCPRGAVLGSDGLCYNRRDIRNSDRMWPRGTRPLLTGGDMRCIRIASGASRKLRRKEKQLRAMGMLPPLPKSRKALAPPVVKYPAGTTIVQN